MSEYTQGHTANIAFPLGGIGTGSIGLSGRGTLVDWEINNRPNRESINPFTGIAIKAEDAAQVIDWRFLQGDTERDLMGGLHSGNHSWGYGQGPNRGALAGVRHFSDTVFKSSFPFAGIAFNDARFPGSVEMTAFNPFIPSNDADSSIPAAFFEFAITNSTRKPINYTIAFSLTNPFETWGLNEFRDGSAGMLTMHSGISDPKLCGYGDITLASDAADLRRQSYWYRGSWFDDLTMFMNDFGAFGPIKPREYGTPASDKPDTCTLTASLAIPPRQTGKLRFVLAWYVPNYYKYWGDASHDRSQPDWRNYYARLFKSSYDAAGYCFANWDRLYKYSRRFADALANSSLPACFVDAIQGNLATLKSSTCLRLTDGDFYGWEGVNRNCGSCEGSCQHVWNYAYALPFLFPKLERGLRDNELKYSLEDNGCMHFRMMLPLGSEKTRFRACVDGQMGTVMKCYREWKLSGDTEWLRAHWAQIRKCIEYAWSPENPDKWDMERTGVLHGRQHHTLDVELFGAYSWLTGFYHGALLAGAEMARAVGEAELSDSYAALYARGHRWLEEHTFNGDHYIQDVNVNDINELKPYDADALENYWDAENRQLKYQIGKGSEIDQVLADWHAGLMGLGNIFEPDHRRRALASIYRTNFMNMRDLNNPCRVFACNGESGVTICAWDDPASKPAIPIPYSEEAMTGFEYAFAGSLLQCGMESEAVEVVSAIRARYEGGLRNPFSEIECGASYARAMASYALLLICSGFRFDMTRGMLGFRPLHEGRYLWSADGAWGTVESDAASMRFRLLCGAVSLKCFEHPFDAVRTVSVNGRQIDFTCGERCIYAAAELSEGDVLELWSI